VAGTDNGGAVLPNVTDIMEQSQSNILQNSFRTRKKREKQKTGKLPNVTDLMEQSQSNIDNKSFRTRKTEKTEKRKIT